MPGLAALATSIQVTDLIASASANAAGANNQTLTAGGRTPVITGFQITGLGATGGSTITVTVTGVVGGTITYYVPIPAGAGVAITPVYVSYGLQGIPATGPGTNIVVNVPSFGAGNTNASVAAQGYLV